MVYFFQTLIYNGWFDYVSSKNRRKYASNRTRFLKFVCRALRRHDLRYISQFLLELLRDNEISLFIFLSFTMVFYDLAKKCSNDMRSFESVDEINLKLFRKNTILIKNFMPFTNELGCCIAINKQFELWSELKSNTKS